ncbi:hypothetical protein SCUCBS95973_001464 [Sporothrix curviconia]|uniref:Mitochondrial seryl-tRNA synthetase n=1 Tax=Sporothrix curviconia TaxID=1260050 RepID=A0ABP0AYU4_9PEZI
MSFSRLPKLGRLFAAPMPAANPGSRFAQAWRPAMRRSHRRPQATRPYSTERPSPSPSSSPTSSPTSSSTITSSSSASRAERILSRLPPSMQKYTRRLKDAPVSHVVAFLILHELTAIVPLAGLFGLFHYAAGSGRLVPLDYMMEHYGGQVADGVRRFEKYFRRKEWFGFSKEDAVDQPPADSEGHDAPAAASAAATAAVMDKWKSDSKYRVVVEVGLAYAITKVLLPVRIAASVWATPWFAGVLAQARTLIRPKKA